MKDAFEKGSVEDDLKCAEESLIELPMTLNRLNEANEKVDTKDFKKDMKLLSQKIIELQVKKIKSTYLKKHLLDYEVLIIKKIPNLQAQINERVCNEFIIKIHK